MKYRAHSERSPVERPQQANGAAHTAGRSGRLHRLVRLQASFRYAFAGLFYLIRTQPNAQFHSVATVAVVGLGLWLGLPRQDWLWLLVAVALVTVTEAMNTALETLADALHPQPHPLVGRAKDVAAGAVLLAAIAAALIGLLVLGPPLLVQLGVHP